MLHSARSAVFVGFESLCRQHHLNAHTLLHECGLDPILLRHQDLLVDYARVGAVLNLAAERSGNQQFGLALSQQRDYLVFGPFGLLLSQAESLADLVRITNQYAHLHAPGIHLQLTEQAHNVAISYHLQLVNRQLLELGVGVMYRAAHLFFRDAWPPNHITFVHPAPESTHYYQSIFQVPVLFSQPSNAIYCNKDVLQLKPSEQRGLIKRHLLQEFSRQDNAAPKDYPNQVKHIVNSLLATGEATLEKVASILELHPRQLQLKLQAEEINFRALLDEVRFDKAQQQLLHTQVRITDLALSLGYADETAFSRAFKRWSGYSPRQWQQQKMTYHKST